MYDAIVIPKDFNDRERELLVRGFRHACAELLSFRAEEGAVNGAVVIRFNVNSRKVRGHKLLKEAEGFASPNREDSDG